MSWDFVGRHSEAADELRKAILATEDQLLLYYGHLLLGGELDAWVPQSRTRAYERAAVLFLVPSRPASP